MPEMPNTSSVPSAIKRVAYNLRITGWIGFWVQLVLAVVSSLTFLFAVTSAQVPTTPDTAANNPGTGGGILFAVCSLLVLYGSIYQAFRYTRLSKQLQEPNPNLRPKKAETIKILRFGLLVSLVGLLLSVLGAEAITGSLLAKSLAQGQSIYNPAINLRQFIQPLDIFVVLANTHSITAHFAGIGISLWLLNSTAK